MLEFISGVMLMVPLLLLASRAEITVTPQQLVLSIMGLLIWGGITMWVLEAAWT